MLQLVWASTTDVGCAIAQCSGGVQGFSSLPGYVIFCNYGIGGNMIGEKPYEKANSNADIGSKCHQMFNEVADETGLCGKGKARQYHTHVTSHMR